MDWLFANKDVMVGFTLIPNERGKTLVGFTSGKPLKLTAKSGETVQIVMDRFNTYRGPESQIRTLLTESGEGLPFSTVITKDMNAIVSV
jgi:hypothetical protein